MKKLITTIAIGTHREISALTMASVRGYAKRVGADVHVVTTTQRRPAHFAKYDLFTDVARRDCYDRVLYIDADIYIRDTAPSIFDSYENAAFNEHPHQNPAVLDKAIRFIRAKLDKHWEATRYFNTGVVVFTRDGLSRLAAVLSQAQPLEGVYYEQDQLNVLMRDSGVDWQRLDKRWNQFCNPKWLTTEARDTAHFLHGTGLGKYPQRIEAFRQIINDINKGGRDDPAREQ